MRLTSVKGAKNEKIGNTIDRTGPWDRSINKTLHINGEISSKQETSFFCILWKESKRDKNKYSTDIFKLV